jgi:hypothetical protein
MGISYKLYGYKRYGDLLLRLGDKLGSGYNDNYNID